MPNIHWSIKLAVFSCPLGVWIGTLGKSLNSCVISAIGVFLIFISILSLLIFIFLALRLAIRGERTLVLDVINHVIRDPNTNEIIFDLDKDGTVRDHYTKEFLCKYDFNQKRFLDILGNVIDPHSFEKKR